MTPPDAPRPRRPFDWKPVLLEAFFVVMGVVLALAANEWRQSLADDRRARTALGTIREEVAQNRRAVLEAVTYHLALSDSLRAFRPAAPGDAPSGALFSRGFVAPATVLSTAWQTATATDAISHMPYDTVLRVSRLYESQHSYTVQAEQVGSVIYGALFHDGYDAMRHRYPNLLSLVSTFWYRECQLLARYDETLALLGNAPAAAPAPPACQYAAR